MQSAIPYNKKITFAIILQLWFVDCWCIEIMMRVDLYWICVISTIVSGFISPSLNNLSMKYRPVICKLKLRTDLIRNLRAVSSVMGSSLPRS